MNEAILLFSWLVYFYFHSFLAATSTKLFFTRAFSIKSARTYRIGYNVFSFFGLLFLIYLQFIIPSALLYSPNLITNALAIIVMVPGLIIIIASIRNYEWKSFMGITKEKSYELVIEGMNKFVRHPLYSGTMIFVSGFVAWQPYFKNVMVWLAMWIYLAVGIFFEEKKLVKLYGDAYKNYQKKVKKMIPYVW